MYHEGVAIDFTVTGTKGGRQVTIEDDVLSPEWPPGVHLAAEVGYSQGNFIYLFKHLKTLL